MIKILTALLLFFTTILPAHFAYAQAFTDSQAINAIIGEAENQGYDGMLAVACAIRNRGTLKGVYGEHALRVRLKSYNKKTWLAAREAWLNSGSIIKSRHGQHRRDTTHGANSWENINGFGKPYWADACIQTVIVKDHVFYRCPNINK